MRGSHVSIPSDKGEWGSLWPPLGKKEELAKQPGSPQGMSQADCVLRSGTGGPY